MTLLSFFFFQAEDGIRDGTVTGVQTCALPIWVAPGVNKGAALAALIAERDPAAILFAGDDLGDLPAFEAVRAARAAGRRGVTVCSASDEVTALASHADLVVDGPAGVTALLVRLADAVQPS